MDNRGAVVAPTPPTTECCMCGDFGLIHQLFQCSICLFRSQHRYCSNLYPKAVSHRVCNWCLKRDEEKIERSHSSSTASKNNSSNSRSIEDIDNNKLPIKKQRSPVESPLQIKKTFPRMTSKPVFRGKVRRYRLLEEVCR